MSRILKIENFGPLQSASLNLGNFNIITGAQSSGKSCVLKIACFCAWVEKRIQLSQSASDFEKGDEFISLLLDFYQMEGYARSESQIEYDSPYMKFSYDNSIKKFSFKWKSARWNYKRPKISYIPADRNLVASIPAWGSLKLRGNMIDFMSDWDRARRFIMKEDNFLNLGLSYNFEPDTDIDRIRTEEGTPLLLAQSSSGIQSLLPMYIHLDYLTKGQYIDQRDRGKDSYEDSEERKRLLSTLYRSKISVKNDLGSKLIKRKINGQDILFPDDSTANKFEKTFSHFVNTYRSEIFLEEPEDNLFPSAQASFISWLVSASKAHNDIVFIATHSPYILNQAIKENPSGLEIFFTHPINSGSHRYTVRQLSKEEIAELYGSGIDLFYNFEYFL